MTKKGYTLIEILIVLGIMGILFSVGFAGFRDFSRRQVLAGVVKQIQGDIRSAQQMALSGQKPSGLSCRTENLNGIYFGITDNPNYLYRIGAVCGDDPAETSYPILKEVNLPSGISVNMATLGVNPIVFKVLGQGTNIPQGVSVVISLTQTGTGNTGAVTVTSGGEIK